MDMSGILVCNIRDCLQTAADLFDWTSKRKTYRNIVWNFEEVLDEQTITRLHLHANVARQLRKHSDVETAFVGDFNICHCQLNEKMWNFDKR